ncbi:hyaluronidase-like [Temnothorax curvispinosus]|uniref:Hyaluronidase n=1 Tax=Temnothorax curvispinosus TaxID=300111 RepID=A0A6J1Q5T8_9HYME|nr:hyaluronidase-like [Temnothorax curvispinosus]XP_024877572.1 hyaluronidase-like [Temnothorax curvispinosus]
MLLIRYSLIFAFVSVAAATFFGFGTTTPAAGNPSQFDVYWNVPSFMCNQYDVIFENLKDFGIRQNTLDKFRGEEIAILYDPGMFPALLTDKTGIVTKRNGGVPQEGDLKKHLETFQKHLIKQIPDGSFSGIGVIDFESWRPIFRQNWASLEPYKTLSINLEREKHPNWSDGAIRKEAKRRFEKYGRVFMEETLKMAKKLRPKATWGYYGYPHCFNQTPGQRTSHCNRQTMVENDGMSWLFTLEDMHLPSVYLRQEIEEEDRVGFVKGRVSEAIRIAEKCPSKQQILPYYWFKYQDHRNNFLSKKDTENAFSTIASLGADGLIIWGSSEDTDTEQKCKDLLRYVKETLGPTIKRIKRL